MKPIKFELNPAEYNSPVVTCKNWYGKEVKFYFDTTAVSWVNASNFKLVEQGSDFSHKLCVYSTLQMRRMTEQKEQP